MLNKTIFKSVVYVAGVALASNAMAQESAPNSMSNSMNWSGQFRAAFNYMNMGLNKSDGYEPEAQSMISTEVASLVANGKVNSKTDYEVRFNLLGGTSAVDYAWVRTKMGPVNVTAGRLYVFQGGFDNKAVEYKKHGNGKYMDNLMRSRYEDGINVGMDLAGELSLQILNDAPVRDAAGNATSWNKENQQTFVLNWTGQKFGPIMPIITYGTEDNQKSNWIDVGVKTAMAGLDASLDYSMMNVGTKTPDGEGFKNEVSTATSITLNVGYEIKGTATPFFYLSTFDNKQAGTDAKVNSAGTDGTMNWDDNAMTLAVGADIDAVGGKDYTPFVEIVSNSGKWNDAKGDEETKSEMNIRVGVHATL